VPGATIRLEEGWTYDQDNSNFVMDLDLGTTEDPEALAAKISPILGVVECSPNDDGVD
jgi:ribose 5-phosphate isomerase